MRLHAEIPGGIYQFRGDTRWLSNFHEVPIEYEGVVYPSTEHAFQAAKSLSPSIRAQIAAAATPGKAKRLGGPQGIVQPLRVDWEAVCDQVMMDVNWYKFTRYPDLTARLLRTSGPLVEGNPWGDQRWGATWVPSLRAWLGQNRLGRTLMVIRRQLGGAPFYEAPVYPESP